MNIFLWVVAALLAVAFIGAGSMKATKPREQLVENGMGWAQHFSPGAVKAIGVAEILGGLGLILPALFGIAPILVPVAAAALALVMLGAVVTHARLKDGFQAMLPSIVLLVLSLVVAWGRFGPYAFVA